MAEVLAGDPEGKALLQQVQQQYPWIYTAAQQAPNKAVVYGGAKSTQPIAGYNILGLTSGPQSKGDFNTAARAVSHVGPQDTAILVRPADPRDAGGTYPWLGTELSSQGSGAGDRPRTTAHELGHFVGHERGVTGVGKELMADLAAANPDALATRALFARKRLSGPNTMPTMLQQLLGQYSSQFMGPKQPYDTAPVRDYVPPKKKK